MRRITSRFVLLIATAAIAPLVAYGVASLVSLQRATAESVRQGNLRVAREVAAQIQQYIVHNQRVLRSVGLELRTAGIAEWQQSRILKDYVLDFPEFREISFFTAAGRLIATSRASQPLLSIPDSARVGRNGVYVSPVTLDTDGLPTATLAIHLRSADREAAWIVGEIALEELWRTVRRIRVGDEGFALLLGEDQRLIAHGDPDENRAVALGNAPGAERLPEQIFGARLLADPAQASTYYEDADGRRMLAVGAPLPGLPWVVIVEQPVAEAFAVATTLQRQLLLVIGLALLGTVLVGTLWGRSFISRIFALTRATRAIAEGRLDERVSIAGRDEIHQLGDAFNSMADRLVQLQDDVRKQERQAMFGKIAAGLVHDLSHPIQNIGNSCKLIQKMYDDVEYRDTFKRTVEREMVVIKRVLEDLRNIAKPIPLERFPVDVDRTVAEVVESMQQHAEIAGLTLRCEPGSGGALIEGDVFALGRVYRNLIINAIQATAPGGLVVAATEARDDRVQIRVYDTGCGIPPDRLAAIFDDFVTTKRRGLGLGLAISKKIVEQMGGQISVASEVGRGTTFVLEFPKTRARPIALVAG
ncbi:MAG TPA: sensor histidine kinase [Vicinamibacterales bacterium]|nr:sensor histidine kinase [Vicinamibacterales bacterium]